MKHITSPSLAVFLSTVLFCASCGENVSPPPPSPSPSPSPGLTQANYDQVNVGMNKEQVEQLLGQPTRVETRQALVFAAESKWEPITVYHYADGKQSATITFKNDQVDGKEANLGDKP